nr:molybdopterin-dependent oxidoreductase [uncultured Desulfobulbus sp.]
MDPSPQTTQTILTTCTRDCPNTCGLHATVTDGKIIRLTGAPEHPYTKGVACHKTRKFIERVYSKERITSPMLRDGSGWHKVSWDKALETVAARIKSICAADGPEAILYYQGYGERTALKLLNRYFFNLLGGVTTLRGTLCSGTGIAAQNLDLGNRISHDPLDHYNSGSMILWARNPAVTNISLMPVIRDIQQRGGRVISIDPYRTRTARIADRHITPAPGMDGFLALAVSQILFSQGQEDAHFLANHSKNAAPFRAIVHRFPLKELCRRADVALADAEYIAETLCTSPPTSILLGWGVHRYRDAHLSIRAIDALAAISGNMGMAGGGVSQGFDEYGPYDQQYWGDALNPERRTLLMPTIGEELLRTTNPKIRMAFITAANPVCSAPNATKVARALKQTEFVVYGGHFLDDTAELAHVFLPATTFLEEDDVMASYGHNYVGPVNRAIEPVGQCRSDFQMFSALAQRFDFAPRFCRDAQEWLEDICSPIKEAGCSLQQLKTGAFRMPEPMTPYADKNFPTPSGKFEFMTEFNADVFPPRDAEFPYTLLTLAGFDHICSERSLGEHAELPEILLQTTEANRLGLKDGDRVRLASVVGSMQVRVRTDDSLRADCVVAERGGWLKAGHGFNQITPDISSTIGQGTPFYETRVSIEPVALENTPPSP